MHDEELRAEFAEWLRPVREADPPSMPAIRRRLRRRRAGGAAAGTAAVAAVAATVFAFPGLTGNTFRPQLPVSQASGGMVSARPTAVSSGYRTSAAYTVSSPLRALVVSAGKGQVIVTGSQRSTVSVTEQIWYSATPPAVIHAMTGTTLTLGCPADPDCDVDYDIQVPGGTAVRVTLGTGAIKLTGLAGPVTATTGTGAISASGLSSRTASLRTGTGVINASLTSPPDSLQASTQVGEINIGLPATASYQVNAQALDTVINVGVSTSSRYVITASTGVGAITVVPGTAASSPAAAMNGNANLILPAGFPFGSSGAP